MARNPQVEWGPVNDLIYGCANQAGEDHRNVGRVAALLAGLPVTVAASTVNRLCDSGMDAIGSAARAIKSGETARMIAGGVDSMSRAPFVMGKADSAFWRAMTLEDTRWALALASHLDGAGHDRHDARPVRRDRTR